MCPLETPWSAPCLSSERLLWEAGLWVRRGPAGAGVLGSSETHVWRPCSVLALALRAPLAAHGRCAAGEGRSVCALDTCYVLPTPQGARGARESVWDRAGPHHLVTSPGR